MKPLPEEWLRLADEDLQSARVLYKEEIWSHVCFHAQQAIEKALKSLIETKGRVEKIHDLLELAAEATNLGFHLESYRSQFEYLNQFYTSARYPFLIATLPGGSPGQKEADRALQGLEEFLRFVSLQIKKS